MEGPQTPHKKNRSGTGTARSETTTLKRAANAPQKTQIKIFARSEIVTITLRTLLLGIRDSSFRLIVPAIGFLSSRPGAPWQRFQSQSIKTKHFRGQNSQGRKHDSFMFLARWTMSRATLTHPGPAGGGGES
jgi:hypothetical protein